MSNLTSAALEQTDTFGGEETGDVGVRLPSSRFLIYSQTFGLRERPFSLIPDPNFLFWSENHSRAYAMLEYGLATFAPITVITGEVGAGKTTLIRHLLRGAAPDLRIGLISNAHGSRGQLLHWVLSSLGQDIEERVSYVRRFAQFEAFLRQEHAAGRHTVLIFDEAQNLSAKMLEELRCFSNLNCEVEELLQIILVGQPELRGIIGRPEMLQFAQRVSAHFHLGGMPAEAVAKYIAHRLMVAGTDRQLFTPSACDLIFSASRGLPRIINQICDYALVYAFAEQRTTVDDDLVRLVITDRKIQPVNAASASVS
ncbi:ExeA family protein [Mesorhizobium loti]|uniref:ExeA family protein n=1 Tax=Rhizobium loti TaxID=381 RepID=UPI0004066A8B|nr:AAA family ATPase [Mesorhizobium loti]